MLNKTLLISALLTFPAFSLASSSDSVTEGLATHLSSLITQTNEAFDQACAAQSALPPESEPEVEFRQFFLTIAPQASFGLSGTLDLEVSPEVTFVWEKTE
jgi:hypothetical protein